MKKMKILGLVITLVISTYAQAQNKSSNVEKAVAVIASIQSQDSAAMTDYLNTTTYIQHNAAYPTGAAVVVGALKSGAFKGTTIKTYRSFTDGDIVVLQSEYGGTWNGNNPQVVIDVFRFVDGSIVEHWDNLVDVKNDGDGTTQFNGTLTPTTDLNKTEANRKLLAEMGQNIFLKGKFNTLGNYFDETNYVQHSVGYGADIKALSGFFGSLPEGTPFYQTIKYLHVEGNFGLMMSLGFPDKVTGLSSAYFDLFRLENRKIVEHWDVVQTIPAKADWANTNGKW